MYAAQSLIRPFDEFECDDLDKLQHCFGAERIYKRRILKRFYLDGIWWGMGDEKTHASFAIEGPQVKPLFCYVREDASTADIEIRRTFRQKVGKRKWKTCIDWHVCTVTKEVYKTLDNVLGPVETCCSKHSTKDDVDDFLQGLRT